MPHHRHVAPQSSAPASAISRAVRWRRAAVLASTAAICAAILPIATADATPAAGKPSLKATLAEANELSQQIDILGQQYDGLTIQLKQAKANVILARESAARDFRLLRHDQSAVGAIAVEGYMTEGMNPALELLQSSSPQSLLNRASIMTQIEQENGAKLKLVQDAATAADRAQEAAAQEQQRATALSKQLAGKVAAIQKKESFFNSQAYAQAEAIFQRTGQYPNIRLPGNSVGVQALRWALTRRGKPYEWGAAGPDAFDCSGLVVWAYAQIGITLMHYTGDLWNEGEHVSRSELEPGDLVFFYPGIEHVGIYLGEGLMIDAPTYGQVVQVQPMSDFDPFYDGAVRIIA
ncbi:MAG: C40 family peptidase [Streptosporangiaceae bacterium]